MIKDDNELVEMEEKEYEKELILQKLIADYPNLLAGEQMDSENPRKWLLVSREMGIALEDEGARFLSLDHLFLDQDGIPTLVEVKRSSDTRLRREVVGQMLDYAANAVVYLPPEEIREKIEAEYYDLALEENFLENGMNEERFWQNVKTNLQAGKVRMVFVADEIPNELKRIIEFLNEQMDPAEVLAVEIKQYVDNDNKIKTLVPRVIGQTSEAQMKKRVERAPLLTQKTFFENLDQYGKDFFEVLFDFARQNNLVTRWGTKGFSLNVDIDGNMVSLMQGYSSLSKFGQTLFSQTGSIQNKVKDSDKIIDEYKAVLNLPNFEKVGNGFRLKIDNNLDEKQLEEFKIILTDVIIAIRDNGLK